MPMQRQEENSLPPEGGAGVAQLADRRHWFQVSPLARVRSLLVRNRILSYLFSGGRILIRVQGEWVLCVQWTLESRYVHHIACRTTLQ